MANGTGTIIELRLDADGPGARITCPPALRPAPGQYLVASSPDPGEALPVTLFPSRIAAGELDLAPPVPRLWQTGMTLALRGPLGQGFRMPATTRRAALAALDGHPARLLPLAYAALDLRAAVTIFAAAAPAGLPAEVEVLPLDLLPEAAGWADFLALETRPETLPELRGRLGLKPFQQPACTVQVLISTAMPCAGLAECGVCAVPARHGWAAACSDGPVFDFQQLGGDARL